MRRLFSALLLGATMLSASPVAAYTFTDKDAAPRMTRRSTEAAARLQNRIPATVPMSARMRKMTDLSDTGFQNLDRAIRHRAMERATERLDTRPNRRSFRKQLNDAESMLPPAIVETGARQWTPRSRPSRRTVWNTAAAQYRR